MQPGRNWFVGTESAAVVVLAAPRLSTAILIIAMEMAVSETALLTSPGLIACGEEGREKTKTGMGPLARLGCHGNHNN